MNDTSRYKKGVELFRGKTKIGHAVHHHDDLVIMENINAITAHDDASLTKQFSSKAQCATSTTCRIFELLEAAGIPAAFLCQLSETEFLAKNVKMIMLEAVARRLAVGSFTKRRPDMIRPENEPYRFTRLWTEFFLKTTNGGLVIDGNTLVEGLDAKAGQEDPLIANPYDMGKWQLLHAKKPLGHPDCDLGRTVQRSAIIDKDELLEQMYKILRKVFLLLEGAWNTLGLRLVDMKIEFGITANGELVVADVIDNDSWRLRTSDWQELSKQLFRENTGLDKVEKAYQIVANLSERIRIPNQALVLWTGSPDDTFPTVKNLPKGVTLEKIVCSVHKQTAKALRLLSELERQYPDGGVILALVGRSNGLGPTLSAHTTWQVISVPTTVHESPHDVWASLEMPSKVPNSTIIYPNNAILHALNTLSIKNPIAYMTQRFSIEERMLD